MCGVPVASVLFVRAGKAVNVCGVVVCLNILFYAVMFALLIYICCVCLRVRTVLEAV